MKKKIYIGKIVTLVANAATLTLLVVLLYSQLMLSHQGPRAFTYSNYINFVMNYYDRPLIACGLGNSILALVVGVVAIVLMIIKKKHKHFLYEAISFIFAGLIAGFALRYNDFVSSQLTRYASSLDNNLFIIGYITFICAFLIIPTSIIRVVAMVKGEKEESPKPVKVKTPKPVIAEMSKEEKRIAKEKAREEELRRREEERRAREKEKELEAKKREQEKLALQKAKAEAYANREKEKAAAKRAKKLKLEKRKKELAERYKAKMAAKAARIQAKIKAREAKEAEKARIKAIKEKEKKAAILAEQRRKAKLEAERKEAAKKAQAEKLAAAKRKAYLQSDEYKAKVKFERRKRRYIRHYMCTHRK